MAPEPPLSSHPRSQRSLERSPISPSGLVTLPEWERSPLIEPHTPAEAKLDLSNLTPERLNGVALFALERADFLWRLAKEGKTVTLTPEQLELLADGFESIGGELGDGVGGISVPSVPPDYSGIPGVAGAGGPLSSTGFPF